MNAAFQKLHIPRDMLPRMSRIFQKGVRIEIDTGCTLESLLRDQWGLSLDYILQKISTLFLNGKPVDDIATARVGEGTTLALSSAMPGLVGAVMRRDGFFSSLRGGITYREKGAEDRRCRGLITVKLFNLLIQELAPRFLARGVFVESGDLPKEVTGSLENRLSPDEAVFISMI